jgi:hypothetical protein
MTGTVIALLALMIVPSFVRQAIAPAIAHSISGRVVDGSTGKPLLDAVVVLWERSKTRSSGQRLAVGANGAFEFPNVLPGSYQVAAEVPGSRFSYRTETVDVEISDSNVTGLGLLVTPFGPRLVVVSGKVIMEGGGRLPASLSRLKSGSEIISVQSDGSFQARFRAGEEYSMAIDNPPDGYYIKAVSAGTWNSASDTLSFATTPPSSLQITLAVGTRRLRGRILDRTKIAAGPQTTVTLTGPTPSTPPRTITLDADGVFEVGRLRAGNYQLQAKQGTGDTIQSSTLRLALANQDRSGIELILKPLTVQKGRVVIEGVGRIEELLRFRPSIEVKDILGTHRVAIGRDGTFEFQSFESEYSVAVNDLPFEYDPSIQINGSSVEVKLRIRQGDAPFR